MSKTYKDSPKRKAARKGRERNISVLAVRRDPPDLRKLSRALIALALAEAAAEAEAQAAAALRTQDQPLTKPSKSSRPGSSEASDD